ncbi:MAG: DUF4388 domain-containing protein, partial [Thermoanaerobaculum sp.]|nr:DUF4388 domain-containing protein [Thermoanaerobaculum sp.]MDW7968773.1 DUF4388 domain-containing protein [Thermoanaerobaculum sp.]
MELRGDLNSQRLPEVLQGLLAFGQSGILEVHDTRGLSASIGLFQGRIAWASCGHLLGEEALLACLFWYDGDFSFVTGAQEMPQTPGIQFPPQWDLTRFLLRATYLADELAARSEHLPPPQAPLTLQDVGDEEDPFDCGLHHVIGFLQAHPGTTLAILERQVPLAPVKVRLALSHLAQRQRLARVSRQKSGGSSDAVSRWWLNLMGVYGGKFRLLLLTKEVDGQSTLEGLSNFLKEKARTQNLWFSFSPNGPSFLRLRPEGGGVFSVTWLPINGVNELSDFFAFAPAHNALVVLGTEELPHGAEISQLGVPVSFFKSLDELLAAW